MAKYIKTEEGYKTIETTTYGKMDKRNPVGSGSFSMNRKADTIKGDCSHAEGFNTTASRIASHAEGYYTTASGLDSHAEGYHTTASGEHQHVQGKFNIDDVDAEGKALNTYAHIVGNGASNTVRSNAHTLDWKGVGWYQGGLQVGGNAQDDGAKNVLLEGDAIPVPTTAEVGQTIAVKTVDENGKPTEWEAISKEITVNGITPDENGNIELGDGYEWHEYKLWGRSIRYIANIPGVESISDWEGLMTVPDPDYPDEGTALDNVLGFISDIFDGDPSEIDTSILEYCGYLATSYLALREAGIFGEDVYFATKLAYPEDQRVQRFHFLYIPKSHILYIYKYRLEESSLCIEYDIANNKILTEVTDLDFPAIRRYVKHTTVPTPSTATVGQTIVVKAVDSIGRPTEWEAVDIPEGFSGSWNDLTDKPFGEDTTITLYGEELVNCTIPAGESRVTLDGFTPYWDTEYRVIYDDVTYMRYCDGDDETENYIGGTGDPFKIIDDLAGTVYITRTDVSKDVVVRVQLASSEVDIKTIDKCFLPEDVLCEGDAIPFPGGVPNVGEILMVTDTSDRTPKFKYVEPSWDMLTNKPFYAEPLYSKNRILYKTGEYDSDKDSYSDIGTVSIADNIELDADKTYDVEIWDDCGDEGIYQCKPKSIGYATEDNEYNYPVLEYLGNAARYDPTRSDTGEPFILYRTGMYNDGYGETEWSDTWTLICDKYYVSIEITVTEDTGEAKYNTIDANFLPKAAAIADVTEAPTAEQFNALLASLRNAGYLAT